MSRHVNADQLLKMIVDIANQFLENVEMPRPKRVRGRRKQIPAIDQDNPVIHFTGFYN